MRPDRAGPVSTPNYFINLKLLYKLNKITIIVTDLIITWYISSVGELINLINEHTGKELN